MIYLLGHILDEKGMGVIFKQKEKKVVNLLENGDFSVVFKGNGCSYCIYCIYIKFRIFPAYFFIVDCLSPHISGPR